MDSSWEKSEITLQHCWKYYEILATQRMSVFNFFTVLAGLNLAGLGITFQQNSRFSFLGIMLSLLLVIASFVFWKLDQRSSFLIKRAEAAMAAAEQQSVNSSGQLFCSAQYQEAQSPDIRPFKGIWTFGRAFRLTFSVMAIVGLTGTLLSALRLLDVISFDAPAFHSISHPASLQQPNPSTHASANADLTARPRTH